MTYTELKKTLEEKKEEQRNLHIQWETMNPLTPEAREVHKKDREACFTINELKSRLYKIDRYGDWRSVADVELMNLGYHSQYTHPNFHC